FYPNTRTGCPICSRKPEEVLLELSFPQKMGLPETISLVECPDCDFAYTIPGDQGMYDEYYQSVQNDVIRDEIASSSSREKADDRYEAQARRLKRVMNTRFILNILDYGCGSADLLRTLLKRYPRHKYHGFDLNPAAEGTGHASRRPNRAPRI